MHSVVVTDERMSFSSAHFVADERGVEKLHGHNYSVTVEVEGPLDGHGMVIDFRELRRQVISICEELDHRVLLPADSHVIEVRSQGTEVTVRSQGRRYVFPADDCVILPIGATTAELLAEYIYSRIELAPGLRMTVCVSESPGSTACYASPG